MNHLFQRLQELYDDLGEGMAKLDSADISCVDCIACCYSPPYRMTTSNLEFEYVLHYMKKNSMPLKVHFEELSEDKPDMREGFSSWGCPLLTPKGCGIHPARPYTCRIYGPYSLDTHGERADNICAFKDPITYHIPPDLPLWKEYASILRDADFKRGYIFANSLLYTYPALEVLMEFPFPFSRWRPYNFSLVKGIHYPKPTTHSFFEWSFADF